MSEPTPPTSAGDHLPTAGLSTPPTAGPDAAGANPAPPQRQAERVLELLERWRELAGAGQPPSPEELCRDAPELLGELRKQIRFVQAVERAALPDTPDASGPPTAGLAPPAGEGPAWVPPALPGYEIEAELGAGR